MTINRYRQRYSSRVLKFSGQVNFLWKVSASNILVEVENSRFITKQIFNWVFFRFFILCGSIRNFGKFTERLVGISLISSQKQLLLGEFIMTEIWNLLQFWNIKSSFRNARPNSPTNLNSTLNRPMASQSGTRYEDRTMQRQGAMAGEDHQVSLLLLHYKNHNCCG